MMNFLLGLWLGVPIGMSMMAMLVTARRNPPTPDRAIEQL